MTEPGTTERTAPREREQGGVGRPEHSGRRQPSRRALLKRRIAKRLAIGSAGSFAAVLALLAAQLAAGNDPALGPKAGAVATARRPPIVKKIVTTVIVKRRIAPAAGGVGPSTGSASSAVQSSAPAPAAAPSAPVAVPAPAPAPTTRTS